MSESSTFDEIMSQLDPAMIVVTTASAVERSGCLVGFHCQAGMGGSLAVWLSKANHTFRTAVVSEVFAVHFLAAGDIDLARLFGTTTGDEVDKFDRCGWQPGPDGVPLLDGCPRRVIGTKRAMVDSGTDHVCVVLDAVDAQMPGNFVPLRLSDVVHLEPGHDAG